VHDDAVAQLAHGDLGGSLATTSSETMAASLRITRRAAMAASIATASTTFLAVAACILPTATLAAIAAASSITLSIAFALEGGHLLLRVLPG
jgi:hypothetical protein